jgi:hypothetical protein
MGFQNSVQLQQAPAVAGDFASANPRAAYPSPEAGFVTGAGGVTVGRFAWVQSNDQTVLNSGQGVPTGFIHREQQALITTYLADSSNVVPVGFPVTIMRTGDYWATALLSSAVRGEKAFARFQDGAVSFAPAGSTIAGASFTAAQSTTVLTVSVLASGTISVGDLVTQASGASSYVLAQLTGTPGGVGTYTLSDSKTVSSGAATSTSWIETGFVCTEACLVNELAVMTA